MRRTRSTTKPWRTRILCTVARDGNRCGGTGLRISSCTFRLASHYLPAIAPLFWLAAFQCSITTTVLRTANVRDAGGFPDTDIAEDWQLAARLARRGPLICLDEPVRIYHRHTNAARNTTSHPCSKSLRATICADCITDPAAPPVQRLFATALRTYTSARRVD